MATRSPQRTPAKTSHARAARARMEQQRRRNRNLLIAGLASFVVVAVVVVLVVVKLSSPKPSGPTTVNTSYTPTPAPAAAVSGLAGIPVAQLAGASGSGASRPPKAAGGQPPLVAGGLPQVAYIGAEYCPYCAAERWALVTALSKFGTFSGLGQATSSASDVFPSTPTFTFYGSTFQSSSIGFQAVEETTSQRSGSGYEVLQKPSAAQQALLDKYDGPAYTGQPAGSIPFLDVGNRWFLSGSQFAPAVLSGKSFDQIAQEAVDPATPIGKAVQAAAGELTSEICQLTNGAPADVCSAFHG